MGGPSLVPVVGLIRVGSFVVRQDRGGRSNVVPGALEVFVVTAAGDLVRALNYRMEGCGSNGVGLPPDRFSLVPEATVFGLTEPG